MIINLIPMAGEGQRFKDEGYKTPKPLIDVGGLPMVVRACNALPKAEKNIFVCRKNHLTNYPIKETLEKHIDNVEIVEVNGLTEGQAMTCMAAKHLIPNDAILNIGASDNDMLYNQNLVDSMYNDTNLDGWVWTFRNNPVVLDNPEMYGWVNVFGKSAVSINCKVPVSNTPMNDHAIIGAFTFKKAKIFFDSVENMVLANHKVNGEFYVDIAFDYAIKSGNKMRVFDVDQYVSWGKPKDYREYIFWLTYFKERLCR